MPTIRIPTPLRPYTDGQSNVTVSGNTVGEAMEDLVQQHGVLRQHLYSDEGKLRAFVNIFLNSEDVRHMQGEDTPIEDNSELRIVPSVAGGAATHDPLRRIDHSALRVNQTFIIALLVAAFILDMPLLVAFVAIVMALGTMLGAPGFRPVYKYVIKPLGIVKPDVVADNPEPHRFSQGLGAVFTLGSTAALLLGVPALGWVLSGLVAALAALNLFGGFCVGCFFYYWLNRAHVPGFVKAPPPNTFPGTRPRSEA